MSRQPNFNVFIAFVSATDALRREPEVENLFDYGSTHTKYKTQIYVQVSRVPRLTQRIRIGVGMGMGIYDEDKEGDGDGESIL